MLGNIGKLVSNIAQKAFPGAGGKLIGGVAGGIASFATGDIFGASTARSRPSKVSQVAWPTSLAADDSLPPQVAHPSAAPPALSAAPPRVAPVASPRR